ncbi:hypothetical protein L208DRAFT_1269810, partial [Tricholoma matsutake]
DRKALLCHMNYPLRSCYNHFQEVANLLEDLQRYNDLKHQPQHQLNHLSPSSDHKTDTTQLAQESMDINLPFIESFDGTSPDSGPFVKKYEGAAEEYGVGVTFMLEFDCDQYAVECVENIYYPFASRDEWELAAILLQSDLSMGSIDSFLLLKLVSATPLVLFLLYNYQPFT